MDDFERVSHHVEKGTNVLLHGPGGTGKSFILREIALRLIKRGKRVALTATTGIAAINLNVGRGVDPVQADERYSISGCTLHRWSGIGLGDQPVATLFARVTHDDRAKKRWLNTSILIIDEISMLGAGLMDKLDFIGKNVRQNPSPFGGLQLVLSGDFLQLPPVKDKWLFESKVWGELSLEPIIFETPKRYQDTHWFHTLLRIRKGMCEPDDQKLLEDRVEAYRRWSSSKKEDILAIKPTILHSKRADVEYENEQELEKLPGPSKTFTAFDLYTPLKFRDARGSTRDKEHYIKPLDDAIPKVISLKVGAQVMLKANLDIDAGLANGSRGVITDIFEASVNVKWLSSIITTVSIHTWIQEDQEGRAVRSQIPLILAWSSTIHKAQGGTLDYAICNIGSNVFCPGQAYVALSRVRSSTGLLLSEFYPTAIKADVKAMGVVEEMEGLSPPGEEEPPFQIEIEYYWKFV